MKMLKLSTGLILGAMIMLTSTVHAAAILTDGNVIIGVDDLAQLNISGGAPAVSGTTTVGVRYLPASGGEYEVTAHGCVCEGWGVAVNGSVSGYANNAAGTFGLVQDSFASSPTTATVVTSLSSGEVTVTHAFALSSATANLYEVKVTITANVDVTDVEYRRVMDWDTDPTPFYELVTIGGTSATALLENSNNGFCSGDPLSPIACYGGTMPFGTPETSGDFVDLGPDDHGANFDFGFGDLAEGDSVSFSIFYGGADDVADAFSTMAAADIEVYSLARSYTDTDGDGIANFDGCGGGGCTTAGSLTPTYIFGFKGVGGEVVVDPSVPEPASLILMGLGLLGLSSLRNRRIG